MTIDKIKDLIRKNTGNNSILQNEMYSSGVNSQINKKYKFGEDKAITRKAIYQIIKELENLGVNSKKFEEFLNYHTYVEEQKEKINKEYKG